MLSNVNWLKAQHLEARKNPSQIAEIVGCTPAAARHALLRHGIYQPKRYAGRKDWYVLRNISPRQLLEDATTVRSWYMLGKLYESHHTVVQDHALRLGVFNAVQEAFMGPGSRRLRAAKELPYHRYLSSRSWIAETWAEQGYGLAGVAEMAGVSIPVLRVYMKRHQMTLQELRAGRNRAIAWEYQNGAVLYEISVMFQLNPAAVYRILKSEGIDTSARRDPRLVRRVRPIQMEAG